LAPCPAPGEEPLGLRARVWPFALDVREVGREHDVLDAHVVAELDRHALDGLDAEGDVLLHVLARPALVQCARKQNHRVVV